MVISFSTWGSVLMINLRYEPASNVGFALGAIAFKKVNLAAIGAAELLEARLDVHATTGIFWEELGDERQSSAPGEYPQLQKGNLQAGVDAWNLNGQTDGTGVMAVGFRGVPHAGAIEFRDEGSGGRAPLYMHFGRDMDETFAFMALRANGSG